MNTSDDVGDEATGESPHDQEVTGEPGNTVVAIEQTENGVLITHDIYAEKDGYWAYLRVEYSYHEDGRSLTCNATHYKAKSNGRTSGNVWMHVALTGSEWNPTELTNDNARQTGNWEPISGGKSIPADTKSVTIGFGYMYDRADVSDVWLTGSLTVHFKPHSPSINPIKNFSASPVRVTGTRGIPGYTLHVYRSFDYEKASAIINYQDKTWSADLQIPPQVNLLSINSNQFSGLAVSDYSNGFELYRAALTSPAAGEIVPLKDLAFSGIAGPGTSMKVVLGGVGTPLSVSANTGAGSSWQASALANLTLGSGNLSVTAEIDGAQNYTNHYTIQILGYPVITNTQLTVPLGFTLTGRNRLSGATLIAYIGASNTAVGTAVAATTDTFSITTTNLDPGAHALTVEQFHSGKGSGRSEAVTFNVKPNPPTVTSTTTGERVRLHGTGFKGGELHFHQPGNGVTPLFSVPIKSDGTFEYDVPLTQLPGTLTYSCRQSVLGVPPARIYSDGWVQLQTKVPTPAPTQLTGTRDGHKLKFSGLGQNWGTSQVVVVIFNNGVDMRPGVPAGTVTNQAWSIVSTLDFDPGTYNQLTAKMWVNNLYSLPANVPAVIIPSPPPVLTPITAPTDQRPRIGGTMWKGSVVKVSVNGGTAQAATTIGASFYLNATSDWEPGTYTVSVTAEFGGQTSTASTQSLTVRTPQPKIETSGSVPLIATITGKGWPGCRVIIRTTIGNQELGADDVKHDGTFDITLLKQAAGDQTLYAVQYESNNPANASIESDRVAVKFGVPTADVTVPAEGGRTPRVSVFSGTTTAQSGTVELWLETTLLRNNIAITNGAWGTSGITLGVGPKAVLVYIRDGIDLSAPTTRNVIVVPEKLKIDSPLTNQNFGRQMRVSGVGAFPGDQVIVRRLGAPHNFPPVTANEHGQWTTNLQHNMVAGNTLAAIARAGAGLDSDVSEPIIPKLLHAPQHFTQPQAGDRTGTKPVFAGLVRPQATVTIAQWFNSEIVLATTVANVDGYWEVQSTVALAEGGAWVQMRDTLDGQHSEWRKSERFEVKSVALHFPAPTLIYPHEGEKVSRRTLVSGRGLAGALVRVYRRGVGSDVLGEFLVGRAGNWSGHLNKDIATGSFVISVWQSRDGFDSDWMVPDRTVEVVEVPLDFGTPIFLEPPPDTTLPLEIRPGFRGTGYSGAVVKVFEGETFLGEATVDARGDWSLRCAIDLAVQTDPHTVRARQYLGDHVSDWSSEATQFSVSGRTLYPPIAVDPMNRDYVSPNPVIYLTAMPGSMVSLFPELTTNKIGTGFADASGLCVIPLYDLPPGRYVVRGKTEKEGIVTGWMTPLELDVVDIG
ncbi:hypothetical protein CP336_04420 [Pseudomonas fluorescens]|nr:hypothetical protein CP336_04420 [Pseudomonas fluorescens]